MRVLPREGGGSTEKMTLDTRFRPNVAGRCGHALNRIAAKCEGRMFLAHVLKAIEHATPPGGDGARCGGRR
jgi:hypothetical protein